MVRNWVWGMLVTCAGTVCAQNAELSGVVADPLGAALSGADISLRNEETGGRRNTQTSSDGFYSFLSLKPGEYRLTVRAAGYQTVIRQGIVLKVGAMARLDFDMRLGDIYTQVTVDDRRPLMNTDTASVGTVVDRDLIDKMPLNGRGLQSLIELSPGTVTLPVANVSLGQFAINGQRSNANYFTVDGLSSNFSVSRPLSFIPNLSNAISAGMIPANNFFGTYSNVAAPESLQEFKIQTSTFAPEFGRSPGGQVGLVTRSGSNRYTGSLFEYLRNDKTDANDWFANRDGLPKPSLRFNDFGGVLGGPVQIPGLYNGRDRTFFFVSWEETKATQPQPAAEVLVPSVEARLAATPGVRRLLDAYPLPNRPSTSDSPEGFAPYANSVSRWETQRSLSLRADNTFSTAWSTFFRYNRAPGTRESVLPESPGIVGTFRIKTETLSVGLTHVPTPNMVNELRFGASRQIASGQTHLVPNTGAQLLPDSYWVPPGYSANDGMTSFRVAPAPYVVFGKGDYYATRQLQLADNFIFAKGSHQFKLGADYRWLSPVETVAGFESQFEFKRLSGAGGASQGVVPSMFVRREYLPSTAYVLNALSAFAQDTWKVRRTLTLTYGLRWELAPGPKATVGYSAVASGVLGGPFTLTPHGKTPYPTGWTNLAPRLGIAWRARSHGAQETVVRLGAGRFFDLGQSGVYGQAFHDPRASIYVGQPLGSWDPNEARPAEAFADVIQQLIAMGLDEAAINQALRELIALAVPSGPISVTKLQMRIVSPKYDLPFTWQWNAAVEQSMGAQTFSASYVAALGRRLTSWKQKIEGGSIWTYVGNDSQSSYHSLQLQFQRRLSSRFQTLLSYTWAHAIDDLSSDQVPSGVGPNPGYDPRRKGSSDFDVRHSLNGAVIAELPSPGERMARLLLGGWTATSIFFARTGLPTDLLWDSTVRRPDILPGQPLYLHGPEYPGGRAYNLAAFTAPPEGRDGTFGRNLLRGIGAWQVDFALRRQFALTDAARLEFRAEAFNILNHPNFSNPGNFAAPGTLTITSPSASAAPVRSLANGLNPIGLLGAVSPLFQIGGPRSMQFAVRLRF